MPTRDSYLNLAVGVAMVCAITVTVLLVRRELADSQVVSSTSDLKLDDAQWATLVADGHQRGVPDAALTVVEFGDFECPFCRRYTAEVLIPFLEEAGSRVRFVFRHWPLEYHRFAYPSARATECAGSQGRFFALHDLLYEKQDSLGLKPYSAFAEDAGVPDLGEFNACMALPDRVQAVERDAALAKALGARGTPTIIVNGILKGVPPTLTELRSRLQ